MKYQFSKQRIGGLIVLGLALVYLRSAWLVPVDAFDAQIGFTSRTLPVVLGCSAVLLSVLLCVVNAAGSIEDETSAAEPAPAVLRYRWRPAAGLVVLMAAYAAAFEWLGFVMASVLFLFAAFQLLGERRIWLSLGLSISLVSVLWFVLTQVFGLYLDAGVLASRLMGACDV